MWASRCCTDTNIKGGLLLSEPTEEDINYPTGFIGWTEDEKVYFHIGSGRWVDISASGGGGGSGVDSINGQKGAITLTGIDPIKVDTSGKTVTISTTASTSGIETITLDEGVLDEKDIELKGDSKQGVKTTITAAYTTRKKKHG